MPTLPLLRESNLRHCSVCVRLPGPIELADSLNLRRQVAGSEFECALVLSHREGGHDTSFLHVEMAVPEWFEGGPPKKNGQKRTFDKLVVDHAGEAGEARIAGTFHIKFAALPSDSFIRAESKPFLIQGVKAGKRGAIVELHGSPYTSLQWSLVRSEAGDEPAVSVTIKGKSSLTLSDEYLREAIEFLNTGLSLLVTGPRKEPQNEPTNA